MTVLRRVADRRFGLALGSGHVPGAFVLERGELAEVSRAIPGPRVFKRIFGFAGRGRHLARGAGPTPAEQAFVDRALRADGAVVVEPWLESTVDLGIHGFVRRRDVAKSDLVTDGSDLVTRSGSPSGLPKSDLVTPPAAKSAEKSNLVAANIAADTLVIGSPTIQLTTTAGGWRSSRLAEPDEVTSTEVAALEAQVHLAGAALLAAGYFGPFGIDAFRHVGSGGPGFVARCEINARYTMGWAIGMGSRRPDLVEP